MQYFCKHRVAFSDESVMKHCEHIFANVRWMQKHPHEGWYGISATVCFNMHEPTSMCSFIPVQRIHSVCAHGVLDVAIGGLNEKVFVAVPIPLKLSL